MKSAPFQYHRAQSVDHASDLLTELGDDAKVIAGGQSLIPLMAMRLARPAHVIDIAGLPDLASVSTESGLRIGATVRQREAELTPRVAQACPILAEVLPWIAHKAIRSRGTVCGSLAHADPAAEIPLVALLLDAKMSIVRGRDIRHATAGTFFRSYLTTDMSPDELLVGVEFPSLGSDSGHAFMEIARRHGDFALIAVAAIIKLDPTGAVAQCRLGAAGVGDVPRRLKRAEAALSGQRLTTDALAEAAEAGYQEIDPTSDIHATAAYRRHLIRFLIPRLVTTAANRAGLSDG